ncbi:nucleotidyltransferase family protein [SAR202 cluster bacterium AD-804-J14_MRT_500m]|nr:nucleotidyltransferase family protein [SAR202 cluster bacterium AD-804-J14_MRT_500m]
MDRVGAMLLAAGLSTRMGEPKPFLDWKGKSLLNYQTETLRNAGLNPVLVILGHRADQIETDLIPDESLQVIHNPHYKQGRSTSIRAGVKALESSNVDSLLILNIDQPRQISSIKSLVKSHQEAGSLITIPTYQGKGGHPVIFSTSLLAELSQVSEDSQGIKALVRRHEKETHRLDLGLEEVLLDFNTKEEYRRAYILHGRN